MLCTMMRVVVALTLGLLLVMGGGCAAVDPLAKDARPADSGAGRVEPPASAATTQASSSESTLQPLPPETAAPLSASPSLPADAPPEMTLEQLIAIALQNQPTIFASQAARDGAQARFGIARSDYFPSVNTTYGYNRATNNVAQGISSSTGNPTVRRVSGRSVNNNNFTATLNQNVFDSFRREGRVQASREDLKAADLDLSTTRQNVILDVQQTYYNYIQALHLVQVNQEAVERNVQNLERARGFFEVGTRPKIDVTRAQVDMANAEVELVRARNQALTTLASLNNAIGVPDHPPYRLKEELEIPPTLGTLEESIRVARQNRTELRAAQARIRSAEASLTVAKRDFLPSLDATANWSYRGQDYPLAPNWLAGVTVSIPVLNPPLFSQLDEVAANLAGAQADEEITRQNIILEIQQSFATLVSARDAIQATEVSLQSARENLELAQGRYQVGVGPLIDVTDAQLALTQAESQNIQAIIAFKLAEAQLRKAMGLLE
jgi:outer membrane protein TolC